MNHDIHSLIGAYAVDAVSDQERADFEAHLQVCADCRSELAGLRAAASALGGAEAAAPPPQLREGILAQIDTIRPLPPLVPGNDQEPGSDEASVQQPGADGPAAADLDEARSRSPRHRARRTSRRWLVAAAAAAAVVIGALGWHPWTGSQPTQVTAVQQVLQAPDAKRYVKHLDGATATVVFSADLGESVLVTEGMAPAPPGHTYQIWYMTSSGKATGAGFITPKPGSDRQRVLLKGNADQAAAVGVTVEPSGGSPQPTTKPIMAFSLST